MPLSSGATLSEELTLEIRRLGLPYTVSRNTLVKPVRVYEGALPDVILLNKQTLGNDPYWRTSFTISRGESARLMRGRLGNMTMQRNRAIRQVEKLTAQNREVMEQLKLTTDKLGEAYQQVGALQTEYDQDMTELARAYQDVSLELRANLPEAFRTLLEQLEQDYTGVES